MMKNKRKNLFFRLFFSNYFFLLVLLLLFFLGSVFLKQYNENKKKNNNLEELKRTIQNLEKKNENLENLINYFNTNFFIEKKAREELGYKKEGEKVIVFKNINLRQNEKKTINTNYKIKISPLFLWWNYFFSE